MISIIVVVGKNRAIGCNNQLLWHIPGDLKRFKEITMGHPLIVGFKTYESIGKPLAGRTNIIVTKDSEYKNNACVVVNSLDKAFEEAHKAPGNDEIFIIGGGSIYEQTLEKADKLYITVVDDEPEADTFFPDYSIFKNIESEEHIETDDLSYTNYILTK